MTRSNLKLKGEAKNSFPVDGRTVSESPKSVNTPKIPCSRLDREYTNSRTVSTNKPLHPILSPWGVDPIIPSNKKAPCLSEGALLFSANSIYFFPYPTSLSAVSISGRIAASSMVEGAVYGSPSAILRMVERRIFPERVLGKRFTMHDSL